MNAAFNKGDDVNSSILHKNVVKGIVSLQKGSYYIFMHKTEKFTSPLCWMWPSFFHIS